MNKERDSTNIYEACAAQLRLHTFSVG